MRNSAQSDAILLCKKINFYKSELLCTQVYNNNKKPLYSIKCLIPYYGGAQNKIITVIGTTSDYTSVGLISTLHSGGFPRQLHGKGKVKWCSALIAFLQDQLICTMSTKIFSNIMKTRPRLECHLNTRLVFRWLAYSGDGVSTKRRFWPKYLLRMCEKQDLWSIIPNLIKNTI